MLHPAFIKANNVIDTIITKKSKLMKNHRQ
jgi:hypothetical protein